MRDLQRLLPAGRCMDHAPRELFALLRDGDMEAVLTSNTPWYCVSCYQCMVRCPQEIPVTDIMYLLKQMAAERGLAPAGHKLLTLYRAFAREIEAHGRVSEALIMGARQRAPSPPRYARQGRLGAETSRPPAPGARSPQHPQPHQSGFERESSGMQRKSLTYGLFPGCAYATAAGYRESVDAVNRQLGIELVELADWNCCGATSVFSLNQDDALIPTGRLFALAEAQGQEQILTVCNACYTTMRKAGQMLSKAPGSRPGQRGAFTRRAHAQPPAAGAPLSGNSI
ncbi:MAG: heterodisulfide reductase-related iron-sulfur binding cluster [Desulfosudis oleivorans]|nr:heterodisulfide reductase-related iron-sulfur binding cluster [Desulfosudis oleivorans]